MEQESTGSFGELLRTHRIATGHTQESLAERAGISVRNIQHLERGESRPLKDTARRLAAALDLEERAQANLLAAAIPTPRRRRVAEAPPAVPPAEAQSAESPTTPRHNLPTALSSFIGRERERTRVGELLRAHRLVTLIGSGGVGKTRLALAVAEDILDAHPDGVWLVELAPLADPALVAGAVAQVLGLREEAGRPLLITLTDHLRERRLLLVLDNGEHLLAACADLVSALLRACPHPRLLVTSREGLGVAGERRYRVPSLSTPDPKHLPPPELAESYEAVRLFVERARERRENFVLTPTHARAVTEVCARLDGVPLAIELAAARVESLSVEAIAARLDERFKLLTGGARDLPTRQRTLRAALDWSWDLLDEEERTLLGRLGVFAGGWTLEAAEVVCAGNSLESWAVLDGLDALVGKSLVQADETEEGESRYRLLETVRGYARERLGQEGGIRAVAERHLRWCEGLAEEAEPQLRGARQGVWLARLEREHDNLRAALTWALEERSAAGAGLRLAARLVRFWMIRGYQFEGRRWLERALAQADNAVAAERARALSGAGTLAASQGDFGQARPLFEASLALHQALGDVTESARVLTNLGNVAAHLADYPRARVLLEEALALRRRLADRQGIATTLDGLGNLAMWEEDDARAQVLLEESLALARTLGNSHSIALGLSNLGGVLTRQGQLAQGQALLDESLPIYEALGDKDGMAAAHGILGTIAERRGDPRRALIHFRRTLAFAQETGNRERVVECLEDIAGTLELLGMSGKAAGLFGAAEALRDTIGVPRPKRAQAQYAVRIQAVRGTLGEEQFTAAWVRGRNMSPEEAGALALAADQAA